MIYALNKSFETRIRIADLIQKLSAMEKDLGGVFSFVDLWNTIGLKSSDRTAKVIHRLAREGVLYKIRRGIYVTQNPDIWVLACRFKKMACISADSVLSHEGLIGTKPTRSVSLIYSGNTQSVQTPFARFRFFKIKRELIFATRKMSGGVLVSDREKAYLDLLYYYVKGARFAIDPLTDVDLWKLNKTKIKRYLTAYKNPKFVKFVMGVLNAHT